MQYPQDNVVGNNRCRHTLDDHLTLENIDNGVLEDLLWENIQYQVLLPIVVHYHPNYFQDPPHFLMKRLKDKFHDLSTDWDKVVEYALFECRK